MDEYSENDPDFNIMQSLQDLHNEIAEQRLHDAVSGSGGFA